ncbi:hypothetical protein EST38_g10243 [Candolleomyces aberdarensis]|uniref:Sugar phosphate transporter domain-containing protein n=1 Tax=Candolleomyces aberdarensis TaxID=2316362 RepID=A0A4V1Q2M5_9AGAR|nr:hypothetical protein EST38_g10243 [Candolleomyces aberdarensis]
MASSGAFWLALYFLLNLALTLYNKLVLIHFPFPYTLTALHALCGSAGTFFLLKRRQVPSVHGKEAAVVLLFSVLYTVNIVVSNASLKLVTVPFHQCVRASGPLFTILLSTLLIRAYSCSRPKLVSLVPVIAGVALATYGDYYFTAAGFFLTLLGTLLASLKTIITHLLQSKSQSPSVSPPPKLPLTRNHSLSFLYPPLSVSGPFEFPRRPSLKHAFSDAPAYFLCTECEQQQQRGFSGRAAEAASLAFIQSRPANRRFGTAKDNSAPHTRPTHASTASIIYTRIHTRFLALSSSTRSIRSLDDLLAKLDLPKLSLTPLQLLYLLSPLAFIQTTLLAYFTGELERVSWHLHDVALAAGARTTAGMGSAESTFGVSGGLGGSTVNAAWWGASLLPQFALSGGGLSYVGSKTALTESLAGLAGGLWGGMATAPRFFLLLNGVLAFMLNVVSFEANRRVGAVGMSVAANVKQVLAVLFSVTLFNLSISSTNALGIALTILGGAWYASVEIRDKKRRNPGFSVLSSSSSASPRIPTAVQWPTKHKVSDPVGPYLDKDKMNASTAAASADIEKVEMERRRHREQLRGDGQV